MKDIPTDIPGEAASLYQPPVNSRLEDVCVCVCGWGWGVFSFFFFFVIVSVYIVFQENIQSPVFFSPSVCLDCTRLSNCLSLDFHMYTTVVT